MTVIRLLILGRFAFWCGVCLLVAYWSTRDRVLWQVLLDLACGVLAVVKASVAYGQLERSWK